jgi:hypothetical protein
MAFALSFQRFTFTWTGAWQDGALYEVGDACQDVAGTYVCTGAHLASAAARPPGLFWDLMVAGALVSSAQLGSDQTRSATSFADVAGLSFPVDAGADYYFEFGIVFRAAGTNRGIALAVSGPASPVSVALQTAIPTSLVSVVLGQARAYDSGAPTASVDAANVDNFAEVVGTLRNGASAGELTLRFASSTAGGAAVTVRAGSFVRWHRLN